MVKRGLKMDNEVDFGSIYGASHQLFNNSSLELNS